MQEEKLGQIPPFSYTSPAGTGQDEDVGAPIYYKNHNYHGGDDDDEDDGNGGKLDNKGK